MTNIKRALLSNCVKWPLARRHVHAHYVPPSFSLLTVMAAAVILNGCSWDAKRFTYNGVPNYCLAYDKPTNREGCRRGLDEVCKVASASVFEYIMADIPKTNTSTRVGTSKADTIKMKDVKLRGRCNTAILKECSATKVCASKSKRAVKTCLTASEKAVAICETANRVASQAPTPKDIATKVCQVANHKAKKECKDANDSAQKECTSAQNEVAEKCAVAQECLVAEGCFDMLWKAKVMGDDSTDIAAAKGFRNTVQAIYNTLESNILAGIAAWAALFP